MHGKILCDSSSSFLLSSSAMRPRHWKQVLRYTTTDLSPLLGRGGTFDLTLLDKLTFGQLLSKNCTVSHFLLLLSHKFPPSFSPRNL